MDKSIPINYGAINQYLQNRLHESGELPSLRSAYSYFMDNPALIASSYHSGSENIDFDKAIQSNTEFSTILDRLTIDLEMVNEILSETHFYSHKHFNMKCFVYRHFNSSQPFLHDHDFIELCHVYNGSCHVDVSGCEVDLFGGDFLIIPFDTPHSVSAIDPSSVILCVLLPKIIVETISFFSLSNKSYFHQYFHDMHMGTLKNFLICRTAIHNTIQETVRKMLICSSLEREEPLCNVIPGLVIILLDELIRMAKPEYIEKSSTWILDKLPEILNDIAENFKSVTLTGIAEKYHFNRTYLSRMIKQSTGQTYTANLSHIRMNMAVRLLLQTDLPICSICDQIGYSDVTHFIRVFKKHHGQTPLVYRKTQRVTYQ